jgi:hypothetical protein
VRDKGLTEQAAREVLRRTRVGVQYIMPGGSKAWDQTAVVAAMLAFAVEALDEAEQVARRAQTEWQEVSDKVFTGNNTEGRLFAAVAEQHGHCADAIAALKALPQSPPETDK